jgi:hypothetical protein
MKKLLILASTAAFALAVAFPAGACPIGMLFNGSGCSPPYEYTGWDLLRDRRAAIDAIGSDSIFNRGPPAPGLTAEEAEALERGILEAEQERQRSSRSLKMEYGMSIPLPRRREIYAPQRSPCLRTVSKKA